MRISIILAVALAAACGSVNERQECAVSTDCPVGEFCTREGGERFCWPDAVAPAVGTVTATCPGNPCRRDDLLTVRATVTDAEEVLGATVTLGLGGPAVEMARGTGGAWTGSVPLREQPFETFERVVPVTVTARDGARNEATGTVAGGVVVTRLRWVHDAGAPMSAPAVAADGTAILGLSRTTEQVLAVGTDGVARWALTIPGSRFVTAAPAVGEQAIWVGSEDGSVYGVRLDGTALLGVSVNTGGAVRGSLAVRSDSTKEWAFGASAAGFVGAVSSAGEGVAQGPVDAYTVGPVLGLDGRIHAATATATATATLRSLRLTTTPAISLSETWSSPPSVGVNVSAPVAVDGSGGILTGSQDAKLHRTDATGVTAVAATLLGSVVGSPVVLSNGDVVVGDQGGTLHRIAPGGTRVWDPAPKVAASGVLGPVVLTGPVPFLVPTTTGTVYAVRDDGTTAWSRALAPGEALREGNLHTPPGQTAPVMSTAYFSASNGRLFAVVVDGALDGTAPWPKAFHDPRNTNRAGAQP